MRSRPAAPPLPLQAFALRLRDLLGTLESASLVGVAEARVRGLGEHLRFACLALPCAAAMVALEVESLGRLRVPAVASAREFRASSHEFIPSGTPFAYLLGGGSGHAVDLEPGDPTADPMLAPLAPALEGLEGLEGAGELAGGSVIFVPIRLGERAVGGAAFFSAPGEALGERGLEMAERLGEVLALTVESFRSERMLFELFARALPDLLGKDAPTSLPEAVERAVHAMRIAPAYRRRVALATRVGRIADRGSVEAALAMDVLDAVDRYGRALELGERAEGGEDGEDEADPSGGMFP